MYGTKYLFAFEQHEIDVFYHKQIRVASNFYKVKVTVKIYKNITQNCQKLNTMNQSILFFRLIM